MPSFTIRAKDFRVMEHLEWSPEGVCLLAGANGSGKSTTLSVFTFLRTLFQRGHERALTTVDGVNLRRLGVPESTPVVVELVVGDVTWKLEFPMSTTGMKGHYGEQLRLGTDVVARAAAFQDEWFLGKERRPHDDDHCCARRVWDKEKPDWMAAFVEVLNNIRVYGGYWLNQVKRVEPATAASASFLHGTGQNLWSVLSNWKGAGKLSGNRFNWVLEQAKTAFPDTIDDIVFDRGIPVWFTPQHPDPASGLYANRAADGLLVGLLHLTAIAGAPDGAIIAIDEFENQLHPHAIRSLLAAIREQADERDLTVVLTTHSPVVMNEFKGFEEHLFVLDPSRSGPRPVPIEEVHDRAWLSHFSLGDLYEREKFGAPRDER